MTNYVVVGDSQAEGLLLSTALPAILGARLVGRFDHRGWSSRQLLDDNAIQTAAGRAAATDAKLLIVAGGNDPIVEPGTPEYRSYENTLLEILRVIARKSALTGRHIDVLWFGPVYAIHDYDDRQHPAVARAQRAILGSAAARAAIADVPGANVSVRWIDSQPITRDLAREANVHFTAPGYRTYAERIVRVSEGGGIFGLALLLGAGYAGWRAWKARREA